MNRSFPKEEKLKRKKLIERLFSEGTSFKAYPLKAFCLSDSSLKTTQAAFSVPKRSFRHATDRNRIKRQIREAYRLHKSAFQTENGKKLAILFVYMGKDLPEYQTLSKTMGSLLKKCYS